MSYMKQLINVLRRKAMQIMGITRLKSQNKNNAIGEVKQMEYT
jgi:hypothetical protein